jgi:AraC-like DNA-binding protein
LSEGVIRVGVTKEILPVLREFGLDPEQELYLCGLGFDTLADEDNVIRYGTLGHLLAHCAWRTQCPHLGLLIGQRGTIASLGAIGGLLQHAPSVGHALTDLVQHLHLHDRGAAATLTAEGDVAMLDYAIVDPGVEGREHITDETMALSLRVMQALCGPDWVPDEVWLPRAAPPDRDPYRRCFQAPVRFAQESASLVFPARWLGHRMASSNPLFHRVFESCVRELEASVEAHWKENLRRVLRTEILNDRCSATAVAGLFSVHRRTMSRHLQADGTGFRKLVNETKFDIACQLLTRSDAPLCEVSAALGYSEASAFTRAFRRWSGQAPRVWRSQNHRCRSGPEVGL